MESTTVLPRGALITSARQRAQAIELIEGIEVTASGTGVELSDGRSIPPELTNLLRTVLTAIASSRTITISTLPDELTTSVAADMLGISRPTLMKLIKDGTIASHKVGTHTRLRTTDVIGYRRTRLEQQRQAFAELRALEEELGLD